MPSLRPRLVRSPLSYLFAGAVVVGLGQVACIALTGVSDFDVVDKPADTGTGDTNTDTKPADTGPSCDAGTALCGGKCVDIKTDNANCGGCDKKCAADQVCADGVCSTNCAKGMTKCPDGSCYDLTKSATHCGSCSNPCKSDQDCFASACVPQCVAPKDTRCTAGDCIDLKTDNDNCGACDKKCDPGMDCCGAACTDLKTDDTHCGSCDNACETGAKCDASLCATSVTFPSTTSKLYIMPGGTTTTLGAGGCGSYWTAGTYVEEIFDRKAVFSKIDLSTKISDCTGGCGTTPYYYFYVYVNGTYVGSFSYKGGTGGAPPISQTLTFAPVTPPGGKVTLKITGQTTVCSGGGTWGFNHGTVKMY